MKSALQNCDHVNTLTIVFLDTGINPCRAGTWYGGGVDCDSRNGLNEGVPISMALHHIHGCDEISMDIYMIHRYSYDATYVAQTLSKPLWVRGGCCRASCPGEGCAPPSSCLVIEQEPSRKTA